jgi:hypothetical protein
MGTLAINQPVTAQIYGDLALRFNGLRALWNCARARLAAGKDVSECAK